MDMHWQLGQETQLSLTNHVMHLCNVHSMTDPLKHAPTRMCYHAEYAHSRL